HVNPTFAAARPGQGGVMQTGRPLDKRQFRRVAALRYGRCRHAQHFHSDPPRRRQMGKKLVLAIAFAAALVMNARTAVAGGLLLVEKADSLLADVLKLIADIDLTLPDEAVTDDELADCGSDDQPPDSDDSPMLFVVDDDKRQCPFAQFTRINDAV